jgi:hypothetical protein
MKTIEQIEAEIAALQAELEARKSEPDFSEAVKAFRAGKAELIAARKAVQRWEPANEMPDPTMDEIELYGLIAAYPALHAALSGPVDDAPAVSVPWPGDDELREMVRVTRNITLRMASSNVQIAEETALEMARRLKEWQDAQVAAPGAELAKHERKE